MIINKFWQVYLYILWVFFCDILDIDTIKIQQKIYCNYKIKRSFLSFFVLLVNEHVWSGVKDTRKSKILIFFFKILNKLLLLLRNDENIYEIICIILRGKLKEFLSSSVFYFYFYIHISISSNKKIFFFILLS